MKGASRFHLGFERKIGYSFVGLLAGNAVLLLYLLWGAIRTRIWLRSIHMGEPSRVLPNTLGMFPVFGISSMLGWALIGLPCILLLRGSFVSRLNWLLALIIGAALGPLALLAIFCVFTGGRLITEIFRNTGNWIFSVLISAVAFLVYCALVRWAARRTQEA